MLGGICRKCQKVRIKLYDGICFRCKFDVNIEKYSKEQRLKLLQEPIVEPESSKEEELAVLTGPPFDDESEISKEEDQAIKAMTEDIVKKVDDYVASEILEEKQKKKTRKKSGTTKRKITKKKKVE